MAKRNEAFGLYTQARILIEIFNEYTYKIPETRNRIIPFMFMVIISRILEIKMLSFLSKLGSEFNNSKVEKEDMLKYLSQYTFLYINVTFLFEFCSFIFVTPVQRAFRNSSRDTFRKYINLGYKKFSKIGSGEIHASVERRSRAVSDILEVVVIDAIPILIGLVTAFIFLGKKIGPNVPFIMFLSFLFFVYMTIYITKKRAIVRQESNRRINIQSNILYDTLINYETVLAYNNHDLEVQRYDQKLADTEIYYVELYKALFILNYLQKLIWFLQMFCILFMGIYGIGCKKFDSETFLFYSETLRSIGKALNKSGYLYNKYSMGIVNYVSKSEYSNNLNSGLKTLDTLKTDIIFKNVSLFHDSNIILENINFIVRPGEKIAIVGRNGVGKSTLLKVILGITEYTGDVLIHNKDLKEYSMETVRDHISYIQQDSAMFNDTIIYNILYGNKKVSEKKIINICKKMGIHESIKEMSNGYQTIAGERGSFLSGGERQKVAFARAAVRDSDMLIMDEPTASLDKVAEKVILENVMGYFNDRTVIMIVHNLQLLKIFDKIVFIEDNTVKEVGSFQDLMGSCGPFFCYYSDLNIEESI